MRHFGIVVLEGTPTGQVTVRVRMLCTPLELQMAKWIMMDNNISVIRQH